jgi:hypothetical protein
MKGQGETIYAFLFYGTIAILIIYFLFFRNNQSGGVTPTDIPSPTADIVNYTPIPTSTYRYCQGYGYLYCWNTGNLSPHHLGHPVYGDHLCTYQELGCQ